MKKQTEQNLYIVFCKSYVTINFESKINASVSVGAQPPKLNNYFNKLCPLSPLKKHNWSKGLDSHYALISNSYTKRLTQDSKIEFPILWPKMQLQA